MAEQVVSGRGGARPGSGRKKGSGHGTVRQQLQISASPEQIERLKALAAAEGLPVSKYIFRHLGI